MAKIEIEVKLKKTVWLYILNLGVFFKSKKIIMLCNKKPSHIIYVNGAKEDLSLLKIDVDFLLK